MKVSIRMSSSGGNVGCVCSFQALNRKVDTIIILDDDGNTRPQRLQSAPTPSRVLVGYGSCDGRFFSAQELLGT